KFVSAGSYLDSYALHPKGYAVAITTRGKAFTMGNWDGPVLQHGEPDGVRYRHLEWLNDGKRLVAIHDATGLESLIVFNPDEASEPKTFKAIEFGRATNLIVSPTDDAIAISNHRNELLVIDLVEVSSRIIDKSDFGRIGGIDWSPDGRWLAYSFRATEQKTAIKLCNVESGETYFATEPTLHDVAPAFDPEGKYLYFLGYRIFNPVYDQLHFDLSFPRGVKPYAITLQRDLRSPFIAEPKIPEEKDQESSSETEEEDKKEKSKKPTPIVIDLEGITNRALPFPVSEGKYRSIRGIKGKALFLSFPIEGTMSQPGEKHEARGHIESYDFEAHKTEYLIDGVSGFDLSRDSKTLIYRSRQRLRVLKAGDKAPKGDNGDRTNRETGWLDLGRVKVSVQPAAEWKQMFAEA
ncbi:MAG TPA: peptidase, partial [Ktedonobacteraceae bacterium]|nr:peptidase [Ktedonobacteraceae bacterium]